MPYNEEQKYGGLNKQAFPIEKATSTAFPLEDVFVATSDKSLSYSGDTTDRNKKIDGQMRMLNDSIKAFYGRR